MAKRVKFGREAFPAKRGEQIGDSFLRRCNKCGMPLDTRKVGWSATGEGQRYNGSTGDDADHTHTGGCPHCDSLNWSKGEPKKLPDDRNMPSRSWKLKNRKR